MTDSINSRLDTVVEIAEAATDIMHRVANDPEGTVISTASGPVPSIAEWYRIHALELGQVEEVAEQVGLIAGQVAQQQSDITQLKQGAARAPYYLSAAGLPTGGDDKAAFQALLDNIMMSGGGELIMDSDQPLYVSDSIHFRSNTTIRWIKNCYITLTAQSSLGHVVAIHSGSTSLPITENVTLYNVRIDGGDQGWKAGNPWGENGLGCTRSKRVRVYGGEIRNCYEGATRHYGTGGNGLQFEAGLEDVVVQGVTVRSCSAAMASQGLPNGTPPNDYRTSKGVAYVDTKAYDCERLINLFQAFSPPVTDGDVVSIAIRGVDAWNCGKGRAGQEDDMGLILLDRFANANITGVNVYNSADYGPIHSIIRTVGAQQNKIQVRLFGDCKAYVSHTKPNSGLGYPNALISKNQFEVDCFGSVVNPVQAVAANMSGGPTQCEYKFRTSTITGTSFLSLDSGAFNNTNRVECIDILTGKTAEGLMENMRAYGGLYATQSNLHVGTSKFNTLVVTFGTGTDTLLADTRLNLGAGGVNRISCTATGLQIVAGDFASDTAAGEGGVPLGWAYWNTTTGVLTKRKT